MTALDPLLAIAVAPPCVVGAPLLHRLVDGELPTMKTREAAEHALRCPTCRDHLRWLELEEQTVREIAAPTPQRFVALWSGRLRERMVAAIADEAGAELVRAAAGRDARASRWSRSRDYLRQLAGWIGRADVTRWRGGGGSEILARFAALLGEEWPPLRAARAILADAATAVSAPPAGRSGRRAGRAAAPPSSPPP